MSRLLGKTKVWRRATDSAPASAGPAGQSWDPFRLPRQPAQVQGSGPASQTVLARKRPNQLVRLPSKPAVPAKGPPGSALPATRGVQQSQQATSARAGVQQGALHSSSTQSQSSSKGYSKPRQTQIVLSKPALPASGQLPASSAAQRAAAAKPQQAARTAQAQHHGGNPPALKRTSYARARPNQLLRLPSLSPGTPRRKRGAAAAQDSPAAKLRKLLLLRRSLSQILALPAQQQPPPSSRLSAAATKPQPTLVKRSRAHLVYVRSAAQGGGSAVGVARIRVPGGKAGAGGPSGQIRRLVYRRAGLAGGVSRAAGSPAARRVPRGSAGGGARVLRARSPAAQPGTSLTWRRGVAAAAVARTPVRRTPSAGRAPGGLIRRRAVQLRRVGSQMYAVRGGGKALCRQATPAKSVGQASQTRAPGSLLKKAAPQYAHWGSSMTRLQQTPGGAKPAMAARVLARAVAGKRVAAAPLPGARSRLAPLPPVQCLPFCRTGKCEARARGACRLAHDASKVAVCPKWLAGSCTAADCALQHEHRPELMPLCTFFLKGSCTKEGCPYLHKAGCAAGAPVCRAYVAGYCPHGAACPHRHLTARMVKELRASRSLTARRPSATAQARNVDQQAGLPAGTSKGKELPNAAATGVQPASAADRDAPQRKRKWRYFWSEGDADG